MPAERNVATFDLAAKAPSQRISMLGGMNATIPIPETVTYLTPPEAAKIVRVSEEKIVAWIRAGKLRAANVSEGRVPRFRIHKDDLAAFLRSREAVPDPSIFAPGRPAVSD